MNTLSTELMQSKLQKKFPSAIEIRVSALHGNPYGTIETMDEILNYVFDAAGRLRLSHTRKLNPTEKSVRQQPKDCVIRIVGEGPYKGQYILNHTIDGWYNTTDNIADCTPMRKYDADSKRNSVSHNAQYCYGGKFEVVTI